MLIHYTRLRYLGVLIALAGALLVPALSWADPPSPPTNPTAKPPKTVRLMTVGSSFSGNATEYLDDFVQGVGRVLVHRSAGIGGGTLAQHWGKVEQHERVPKDPHSLYSMRSLKQESQAEPWDFVTIQQASFVSHDLTTYRPFATKLNDFIQKYASQAKVVVHQNWAYRCDDPRFTKPSSARGTPTTTQAMCAGLTDAYETIASEPGVRMIPTGDAFHLADTDTAWGYQPDTKFVFQTSQHPALPDQTHSLQVGWQ